MVADPEWQTLVQTLVDKHTTRKLQQSGPSLLAHLYLYLWGGQHAVQH